MLLARLTVQSAFFLWAPCFSPPLYHLSLQKQHDEILTTFHLALTRTCSLWKTLGKLWDLETFSPASLRLSAILFNFQVKYQVDHSTQHQVDKSVALVLKVFLENFVHKECWKRSRTPSPSVLLLTSHEPMGSLDLRSHQRLSLY